MKSKFFILILSACFLASCNGGPNSSTTTDTSISTDSIVDSNTTSSSSEPDNRPILKYEVDFASKRARNFGYNDGNNQQYFLTDYFRNDGSDIVSSATTTVAYCDTEYVRIGSGNSFGSITLTINSKYEAKQVIVRARGYSNYDDYNGIWRVDDSTLKINGESYKLPYEEGAALEPRDCLHDYSPATKSIFMETTGDAGKRVQLISMEIYYIEC